MLFSRRCARRVERACCTCATYFPLAFVYGLTSWALWVQLSISTSLARARKERGASGTSQAPPLTAWIGPGSSALAGFLYLMLVWCYTTAVFTPPGSTTNDQGYSTVPDRHAAGAAAATTTTTTTTPFTVKANGELRFCKKCQARKPDRAHHCSTCRRCVLKMDHHCPWLATCIGLRNGKAFVLFLVYTTLYALFAFAVAGAWVWTEIASDATYTSYEDSLMPIQYIMLCVIAGIIGLVVGLFTAWHIWLACRGMTTIECMEKTRYQSPLRGKAASSATLVGRREQGVPLPQYGQQLRALGGDSRKPWDEEQGLPHVDDDSDDDDDENRPLHTYTTATGAPHPREQMGRRLTLNQLERYRAQKRHDEYLDEQDSQALPHAFDLGLRRNLRHMLGPTPWLWLLPICNTTGDGWAWEPSPKWLAARDRVRRDRDAQRDRERAAGWGLPADGDDDDDDDDAPLPSPPIVTTSYAPRQSRQPSQPIQPAQSVPLVTFATNGNARRPVRSGSGPLPSKADRVLGRDPQVHGPVQSQSRKNLDLVDDDDDDDDDDLDNTSEDDGAAAAAAPPPQLPPPQQQRQQHRSISPLHTRWMMPDPAARGPRGLLLQTATGARSPTRGAAIAHHGSGAASPLSSLSPSSPLPPPSSSKSIAADSDDGGVD